VIEKAKIRENGVPENTDAVSRIRHFVLQKFPLARKRRVADGDNLLESGIIDSLGVLELVTFMQQEFSVTVDDEDLTPENFQNIERMARFVARSLELQPGSTD
jgi:acyl carrier protein